MHIVLAVASATGTVSAAVLRNCLASPAITQLSILSRRYQMEVSKEEYIHITYDYPLAAAKAFSTLSGKNKLKIVYVSGEGAAPTEEEKAYSFAKSRDAEVVLRALPSDPSHSALRVFNVRPGFVDPAPVDQREKSWGLLKRTGISVLGPVMRNLMPAGVSPADLLAKVLVDLATGDGAHHERSDSRRGRRSG
ncbi:hypothetical protein C8R47DRAFT_1174844 [Mycena vitilis]|nr:hypothetical protein C8R47DRAFT_1174844 [Mycena vitilis]